jgi:hypothetical protein
MIGLVDRFSSRLGWGLLILAMELCRGVAEALEHRRAR